jgi:hypothetical protein
MLADFSGFNCLLNALISLKRTIKAKCQSLLSRSSFGFKASLFLLFKFADCSAISRVVVVFVMIVIPHVGPLMILRRLAYATGNTNSFLIIYW